ncbi:hypothetical protein [Feifania hominis]|uniref:Uncharacterized protein n=1 Tax=Feifania hominis TaxID=2763660 RepID=A0A926HVQ3_9FIRM|nr:hypothetical protein [Feifania hominis]MBC8537230.1 hypothetical protein [Feifania hominis]
MTYPTYKDLCINVLLRLGEDRAVDGGKINLTSSVASYLKAMPMLLRDALNLLATAGKYVTGTVTITQPVPEEPADGVLGEADQDGEAAPGAGEPQKRGDWNYYDLREIEPDFFGLREVRFVPPGGIGTAGEWRLENERLFAVPEQRAGTWYLNVNLYPQEIPDDMDDSTQLLVDPEVYTVLPLYIEGKLRQIGDEDYSATILNEFEQRRAELLARSAHSVASVRRDGTWDYD